MKKAIFWTLGLVVGIPVALILLYLVLVLIYHPAKHKVQVWQANAQNRQVWEYVQASIVRVRTEVRTGSAVETIEETLVCHEGYTAYPAHWKANPSPDTRREARSIGPGYLNVPLPKGFALEFNLSYACAQALRADAESLPLLLELREPIFLDPNVMAYCEMPRSSRERNNILRELGVSVGPLQIVSMQATPLRSVVRRRQLGTSAGKLFHGSHVSERWSSWHDLGNCPW